MAVGLVGLAGVGMLLLAVLNATNGHFEYTLDDPYIHLRLAEQIARGTYGINPGEAASPSSSPLWPFLLAPFAGLRWHALTPWFISTAATVASLVVSFDTIRTVPDRRTNPLLVAAAVLLVAVSCNWFGLPFTGMEHSLQVTSAVCSAAVVVRLLRAQRVDLILWVGVAAGPLVRYENVILAGLVVLVAWQVGLRRAAIGVAGVVTGGLAAFSAWLLLLGLPPLPSSILVKTTPSAQRPSTLESLRNNVTANATLDTAVLPMLLAATVVIVWLCARRVGRPDVTMAGVALLGVAGHLVVGRTGAFGRYEAYALSFGAVLLMSAVARNLSNPKRFVVDIVLGGAIFTAIVASLLSSLGIRTWETPAAARSIFVQQHQMHALTVDHLKMNVAVNDLGQVSYRNPRRVLDLWGLGNFEAFEQRTSGNPDWMDEFVDTEEFPVALIYTIWFYKTVPESWLRVAQLQTDATHAVAQPDVDVYVTDPGRLEEVLRALKAYAAQDHPGTRVVFVDAEGQPPPCCQWQAP